MDDVGLPLSWGIIPTQRLHRVVRVPNPAVATDWSLVVPGGVVWRILCGNALLTTDANAANRQPFVIVDDGNTNLWVARVEVNIVAASAASLNFWPGGAVQGSAQIATAQTLPFPDRLFYAGDRLRVATTALQVGDQWSGIAFDVLEYQVRGLEEAVEKYERALASLS